MRSKSLILLALALGCGLVAAIGISQVMDGKNRTADAGDRQPVFVAMTDINANEEMTAQNIKLEEWPKNIVPAGALTRLEQVEGKRCRMKLYAGEPILSSKLVGAGEAIGAAKDIPPGYRVAHVKVDSVAGASNLILPGDRVDVVVFRQPNSDMHATAAKIVLQDIKVFAVDTHTETEFSQTKTDQTEPMSAKTIALLVTPPQAVILHAASEMAGAVRLVLRNPEDKAHVVSQGATINDIFGPDHLSNRDAEQAGEGKEQKTGLTAWLNQQKGKGAPATPPSAPSKRMIVILGAQLTQVDIPDDGSPPMNQPQQGSAGSGDANDNANDQTDDNTDSGLDSDNDGDAPALPANKPGPGQPVEEKGGE
jgi:pilus assembly protein CpaB